MGNLKKRTASFRNACNGILHGLKTEAHFRFHVFAATLALVCAFYFRVRATEWIMILFCIAAVMSLELLNSALERISDRITKEYDPLIGYAKDLAAGAVLIFAGMSFIIGAIIFIPYMVQFVQVFNK